MRDKASAQAECVRTLACDDSPRDGEPILVSPDPQAPSPSAATSGAVASAEPAASTSAPPASGGWKRIEETDADGRPIVRYQWDPTHPYQPGEDGYLAPSDGYIDSQGRAIQLWGDTSKAPGTADHGYQVIDAGPDGNRLTRHDGEPPPRFARLSDTERALEEAGYEPFFDPHWSHAGGDDYARRDSPTLHVTVYSDRWPFPFGGGDARVRRFTIHTDHHSPIGDRWEHLKEFWRGLWN